MMFGKIYCRQQTHHPPMNTIIYWLCLSPIITIFYPTYIDYVFHGHSLCLTCIGAILNMETITSLHCNARV